jgi:hypothetical protein
MFSLSRQNIENSITQEEFTKLIGTRVSQEEFAPDRIHLRKSLLELVSPKSRFSNNPLYIANLILLYTRNNKEVSIIVDYIMNNHDIVNNEEYFKCHPIDKNFYQQAVNFLTAKEHNNTFRRLNINPNAQEQYLNMDSIIEALEEHLGKNITNQYLLAILLYDFTNLELRRYKYFTNNPKPEDEENYQYWIGDGNGGNTLREFKDFLPAFTDIKPLVKERHTGNLNYVIYAYAKNPTIVKFIGIDGFPYGVFFVTKLGTPRGVLVDLCKGDLIQTIVEILVGRDKKLTL